MQKILTTLTSVFLLQRDTLLLEASNVARCVSKGKSEPFECRNHIRVLQPLGDGERLYVCGTNAHSPKDWVVYVSRHQKYHFIYFVLFLCIYNSWTICTFMNFNNDITTVASQLKQKYYLCSGFGWRPFLLKGSFVVYYIYYIYFI